MSPITLVLVFLGSGIVVFSLYILWNLDTILGNRFHWLHYVVEKNLRVYRSAAVLKMGYLFSTACGVAMVVSGTMIDLRLQRVIASHPLPGKILIVLAFLLAADCAFHLLVLNRSKDPNDPDQAWHQGIVDDEGGADMLYATCKRGLIFAGLLLLGGLALRFL